MCRTGQTLPIDILVRGLGARDEKSQCGEAQSRVLMYFSLCERLVIDGKTGP